MSSVPPLSFYGLTMAISWTTLAMAFFPAANGAFGSRRPNPMNLHVVSSLPPPIAIDGPPPLPVIATDAKRTIAAPEALAKFATMMADEWEGESFPFPWIMAAYRDLAPSHNWPSVTPKAVAMALKRHGCKSETGPRGKDGSRPSVVTFPSKPKRRRRKQ